MQTSLYPFELNVMIQAQCHFCGANIPVIGNSIVMVVDDANVIKGVVGTTINKCCGKRLLVPKLFKSLRNATRHTDLILRKIEIREFHIVPANPDVCNWLRKTSAPLELIQGVVNKAIYEYEIARWKLWAN